MADPDWTKPCEVLAWLRPQYYAVASGQQVIQLREGDRETRFSIANVSQLDSVMRQLESECQAAQSKPRRRAFTAG